LCNLCDLRVITSSEAGLSQRRSGIGRFALVFLGLLAVLMAALSGFNLFANIFRICLPVALVVSMWIPGMAGLIVARRAQISVFGSRFPRTRYLALAVIAPVGVCAIVYGALWFSGSAILQNDLHKVGSGWQFALGFLLAVVGALGEEIGWRGFLAPLLARRLGFATLVWCSWLPWFLFYLWLFFVTGSYSESAFWLQMATIGTLLFGLNVLLVWLRLKTGSVWPPVLFHAMHNFLAFNPMTLASSHRPWLSGELGLALDCGYLAISVGSLWDGSRERLAPSQG
jgi:membrane protease YdiL (CAAX protease family)